MYVVYGSKFDSCILYDVLKKIALVSETTATITFDSKVLHYVLKKITIVMETAIVFASRT